jgi:hypothetical protein
MESGEEQERKETRKDGIRRKKKGREQNESLNKIR